MTLEVRHSPRLPPFRRRWEPTAPLPRPIRECRTPRPVWRPCLSQPLESRPRRFDVSRPPPPHFTGLIMMASVAAPARPRPWLWLAAALALLLLFASPAALMPGAAAQDEPA